MPEELDTLISVVDVQKFFTGYNKLVAISIFARACPTNSITCEAVRYVNGNYCLVTERLVHIKLSDICSRSEEMLAAKDDRVNREFWTEAQAFVKHELTENYKAWRSYNGRLN